jgi:arylsulfatase A-like enzyme
MWVARYILGTRSHIYARLFPVQTSWRRSAVGGGLAAGRHLTSAIGSHPKGGIAWFAHLLLPHRPVNADEECRVQTDPSRQLPYNDLPDEHPTDLSWRAELRAYAGQVRCAHRVLAGVLDAIDRTVGRDHSIVIVHGDHGSRMHQFDRHHPNLPLEAYTPSELNSDFATLLAVRRPQVPGTLHREPAPVQEVIWELVRSGFTGALPEAWPQYVGKMPDRTHAQRVRPLAASDMPWARRPD